MATWCHTPHDRSVNFSLRIWHSTVQKSAILKQEVLRRGVKQGNFTMEQQNEPSEPEYAVNISHSQMNHNKTLKDAYSTTAATILGVFQMIIGVVSSSFFGEIDFIQNHCPYLQCFSLVLPILWPYNRALCDLGGLPHLRSNCHQRSSKWQQVPRGGHHGDGHRLCPLCTSPFVSFDQWDCILFWPFQR